MRVSIIRIVTTHALGYLYLLHFCIVFHLYLLFVVHLEICRLDTPPPPPAATQNTALSQSLKLPTAPKNDIAQPAQGRKIRGRTPIVEAIQGHIAEHCPPQQ